MCDDLPAPPTLTLATQDVPVRITNVDTPMVMPSLQQQSVFVSYGEDPQALHTAESAQTGLPSPGQKQDQAVTNKPASTFQHEQVGCQIMLLP